MKNVKLITSLFIMVMIIVSCGQPKRINGKTYDTYGLFSEDVAKNDSIQYSICGESVVCGIIFVETIIVPIYCFGFDLYEPEMLKDGDKNKGVIGE